MSFRNNRIIFFKKIKEHYGDLKDLIKGLIEKGVHPENVPSNTEIAFILKLISKIRIDLKHDMTSTTAILEEMITGGHLKFDDNGSLYKELTDMFRQNIEQRRSSHSSCVPQYSFYGVCVKEVLFGISEDSCGKQTTWIQFEKHNTKTVIQLILHIIDYIMHRWSGQNIGPYGCSDFTESKPYDIRDNNYSPQ